MSAPDEGQCLDTLQLTLLEQSFRDWVEASSRPDIRIARRRILLIFLLIRYTGAKLSEVLALDPYSDIDHDSPSVRFCQEESGNDSRPREVQISEALSREIASTTADPAFRKASQNRFGVDPGFVRRKFYERAEACGFPKRLAGPEMIRRARAVRLQS